MHKRSFLNTVLLIASMFATPLARATTHFVSVDGSGFSPANLSIAVGDTVVWVNNDELFSHSATSDLSPLNADYWNALLLDYQDTFAKTFNNAGTFTYRDQLDVGTGSITVSGSANQPPEVSITNPAPYAIFAAPAMFTVEISVQDLDGPGIAAVEFLVDGVSQGFVFAEPFAFAVTNLAAGEHTMTAIAADGLGAQASDSILITVNPAKVLLCNPRIAGGFFLFEATGLTVGKSIVVQTSTDLSQWDSRSTNTAASAAITITNTISPGHQFHRVIQLP